MDLNKAEPLAPLCHRYNRQVQTTSIQQRPELCHNMRLRGQPKSSNPNHISCQSDSLSYACHQKAPSVKTPCGANNEQPCNTSPLSKSPPVAPLLSPTPAPLTIYLSSSLPNCSISKRLSACVGGWGSYFVIASMVTIVWFEHTCVCRVEVSWLVCATVSVGFGGICSDEM